MRLVVGHALALVAILLVINDGAITAGSPLPGFGAIPDLTNMGHAFGAKISNIIKGNTYDQYERVMKKLPRPKPSTQSDESPMFGFSGEQFEQLLAMLQQTKHNGHQGEPSAVGEPIPFAAIDNGVD